tara:strand:+ start:774 stop:1103 length:330 start_codon:yes stop_codon:yes gene_type:complete
MSVNTNIDNAESSIRKALINALAEGEDQYLNELFEMLKTLQDLKAKVNNTIRFTNNIDYYNNRSTEFNLDYNADNVIQFPTSTSDTFSIRHGGDLDALDGFEFHTDDNE